MRRLSCLFLLLSSCAQSTTKSSAVLRSEVVNPTSMGFGIYNMTQLKSHWQVVQTFPGVTYSAMSGDLVPFGGATVGVWRGTGDVPDVMSGVTQTQYADEEVLVGLIQCVSGPQIRKSDDCWFYDLDWDGDVDQTDYGFAQALRR